MSSIIIDEDVKSALSEHAVKNTFFQCVEIFSRGKMDEIVLVSKKEVEVLVALVDHYTADVMLSCPYHDENHPFYNPIHDEKFDFANLVVATHVSHALAGFVPTPLKGES